MTIKRPHKDYSPVVLTAAQEDEVLRSQAQEIREIYGQKNTPPFVAAFFIFDKYKIWREKNPEWGFNFYLYNLIEVGKLKSKESTLKLSYKVAACFPDLRDPTKQLLRFDCYREIVNTKLLQDQMNELRQEAEEYHYSGRKIREMIKKILGQDAVEDEHKENSFEKTIVYRNDDQFLQAIKELLPALATPPSGTKFRLKKVRR